MAPELVREGPETVRERPSYSSRKGDQGSKEKIATGMDEAGRCEVGKAGSGEAGKDEHGHGADPSKLAQGMAKAGAPGSAEKGVRGGAKRGSPL